MFSRVLVGVDGAAGGRDAIALAKQLADPEANIALVHVYGAGLMPYRGAELLLAAELEESEQLLQRESAAAAPGAELIPYAEHSIGRALHTLAEREGADLIVIGACHRGSLGRVLIGNDTIEALNGAPCAVAIAPYGYAERAHRLVTLGVGYDGSPESERALSMARDLAARSSTPVKALLVISLQSIPYDERIAVHWPDAAGQLRDDQVRRLRRLEDVEGEVTFGDASDELVSFGERLDLLIVGSRGYGPVGRLLHGSTSNQLARRSRCPLLVLPRSAADVSQTGRQATVETAA